MWAARKSTGELVPFQPEGSDFAVSARNTTDQDYVVNEEGQPIAVGLLVVPRAGREPAALRGGMVTAPGKVMRVLHTRRPGRPTMVWVAFPRRDNPDATERFSFPERDLHVVRRQTPVS
jgi:hypothetical protein